MSEISPFFLGSTPRRDWIAVRTLLRGNQRAQTIRMGKPCGSNWFGNGEILERFLEYLPPSRKVPSHNRMFRVSPIERLACVFHVRTEKLRGVLILHLFDALTVGVAKKKADHSIGKNTVDKAIDYFPNFRFAAQLNKKTFGFYGRGQR